MTSRPIHRNSLFSAVILTSLLAGITAACSSGEFAANSAPAQKKQSDNAYKPVIPVDPVEVNEPTTPPPTEIPYKDGPLAPEVSGDYKICTKVETLSFTLLNDVGLGKNSGYASQPGTATYNLPDYVVSAKGYIQKIGQDDAGAWLEINGTRVLEMINAYYGAGSWTFNGNTAPISYDDKNTDTLNWLRQIGGASKAAKIVVQGFPLNAGANTIKGNVSDVFGAYRSLGVTLQVRSVIPNAKDCP